MSVAPTLVFAVGNPSRGDDAVGPLLAARLEAADVPGVEMHLTPTAVLGLTFLPVISESLAAAFTEFPGSSFLKASMTCSSKPERPGSGP